MRRALLLTAAVIACGPSPSDTTTDTTDGPASSETTAPGETTSTGPTTSGTSTSSSTDASTSSETTAGSTTDAPLEPCTCVVDDECPGTLNDCAPPQPCGRVDEQNEEATDCVLQLMLTQEFAEFSYCNECGGFETYDGNFVILGPGQGIDLECHIIDFSMDLLIRAHDILPPDYFADCIAIAAFADRRKCLLNGFNPGDTLPLCPID